MDDASDQARIEDVERRLTRVEGEVGEIKEAVSHINEHELDIELLKRSVTDLEKAADQLERLLRAKASRRDVNAAIDKSWLDELRAARESTPLKQSAMWAAALVAVEVLNIIANYIKGH